jgi:hypothetical protein
MAPTWTIVRNAGGAITMGMTGVTSYGRDGFRGTVHLRLATQRMPGMQIHINEPCTSLFHSRDKITAPFCPKCGGVKGNKPRAVLIRGWKLLAGSAQINNGQINATLEVHFKRATQILYIGDNWIALKPKRAGVLAFVDCLSGEEIEFEEQPTTRDTVDDP